MKKTFNSHLTAVAVLSMSLLLMVDYVFINSYAQTVTYTLTTDNFSTSINGNNADTGTAKFAGELVRTENSILNNVVTNHVELRLARQGTPTGLFYVGVWTNTTNMDETNAVHIFGSLDASELSTLSDDISFESEDSIQLDVGHILGVFYDGGATTNEWIQLFGQSYGSGGGSYNGTSSVRFVRDISGTTTEIATQDTTMRVFSSIAPSGSGFCDQPENQNILRCVLEEQQTSGLSGASELIGNSLSNTFIQVGLIDGSDSDPATNGTGYAITIGGFAIMTSFFFVATRGRLQDIPTFIWMIGSISLLGALTAFGYLQPQFFIIGIIIIVALASMQVRSALSSGLNFNGRGDF